MTRLAVPVGAPTAEGTKAIIYDCHLRAIDYALRYAEREFLHSRSGKAGIIQEDITGVIGASFTHYDSRAGDPQLHDHCVVWNRARSVSDGQWRTLDSRGLFKSVVTIGQLHQGVLADMLTEALGVGWDAGSTRGWMRKHEMSGIPESLLKEFSQRTHMIQHRLDDLIEDFRAARGREPTPTEQRSLAQRANLETRDEKQHRSLAEMSAAWRERAAGHLTENPEAWVATLRGRNDLPLLRRYDLTDEMLAEVARLAVDWQGERRSTFSRANLMAETARQLEGLRFRSPDDRIAVIERATAIAVEAVVQVTPPELLHVPERYRRTDGSSRLRPADQHLYTTATLIDAEGRLLDAGRNTTAATVPVATVAVVADAPLPGKEWGLSTDQAVAVEKITRSGRVVDVLQGPAGTGKSTTMAGLRTAWENEHGPGSVLGLAPSAAAADVLGGELGIDTENTAKWLHEHRQQTARRKELDALGRPARPSRALQTRIAVLHAELDRWDLKAGQLVIVDEASLAGTFALDELVSAARDAGAKVLLVGDTHQLGSVDAGGMFRALVRDRDDFAPELTGVRRFQHGWEKTASLQLRLGNRAALDLYDAHGRVRGGSREDMLDAVYHAWLADTTAGKESLMIAGDAGTVTDLNRRARQDRMRAGLVEAGGVDVADGQTAGVGDQIVTRHNQRELRAGRGWVKNGDRWTITAVAGDGTMTVTGPGGTVVLPAWYVAKHVELA